MDIDIHKEIKRVDVFSSCDDGFIALVAKNLRIKELPSDSEIIRFGEETTDVYINFDGILDVSYLLKEGKKVTFTLLTPYSIFGEISSIDGKIRSANIRTLSKSKLGIIRHEFFTKYMLTEMSFLRGLIGKFSTTIRNNNQQIVHLASADSKKKVLIQLLRISELTEVSGGAVKTVEGLSHDALASFIGLSRETVTRMIGELKKENYIVKSAKGNIVLNMEKIASLIQLPVDELRSWGNQ